MNTFTIFARVFKANECMEGPRLEPLLKDLGFSLKYKQGSAFWVYANNLGSSENWNLQKWEPDPLSTCSNLFVQQLEADALIHGSKGVDCDMDKAKRLVNLWAL